MKTSKLYPDHTLENGLRDRGVSCRCLWEMKGPPSTHVAWIVAYLVEARVVLVQTFKDGGWDVFLPSKEGKVEACVDQVAAYCAAPQVAA